MINFRIDDWEPEKVIQEHASEEFLASLHRVRMLEMANEEEIDQVRQRLFSMYNTDTEVPLLTR